MRIWLKLAVILLLAGSLAVGVSLGLRSARSTAQEGFAAIAGEVRLIEAKVIGAKSAGEGLLERAYEVAWSGTPRTVPPGKKWVVVVTPTDQFAYSGDARERWRGFALNLMGVFRQGDQVYHGQLPEGIYTNLDLYIYNTMQFFADTPANHAWAKAPVMYLVLEIDAQ
ncbi:MAG: hypothetical protein NUW06_07810 [Candidatus Acetothermia bacterium]|jgi:hypothetical protein|nr:hypothetical protein [Candidatus Acetothermia bacterium]MDH7505939.1 hypothetical protein [Candidatus Acetothermia bacterium]